MAWIVEINYLPTPPDENVDSVMLVSHKLM